MGLFTWSEEKIKNLRWYDIGLLKLAMICAGIWLAILVPALREVSAWFYGIIWVGLGIYLMGKILS